LIIFLAAALAAILSAACFFAFNKFLGKKKPAAVRNFSFSAPESLAQWEEKVLARNGKKTDYSLGEQAARKCLKASANDSASALFYKENLSHEDEPFVSWDWYAEKFPDRERPEALDKKQDFDFAAQFYVIFYSRFFLKTKAIQYVWTQSIPAGTTADNPYTPNVKVLVLESGAPEAWKHEERNISADYSTLFGEKLDKDIVAVSFMTDSDSTASTATAYFDNVKIGYMGGAGTEPSGAGRILDVLRRVFERFKGKEQPSNT